MEKCHFFLPSVNLLGHVISREGIQPDDEKIIKVKDYPRPTTVRQIRSFLGLASYYRKFIANFSTIAKPLNQLLEKQSIFEWNDEQEKAFKTLKKHLISAPILRYPDFKRPFYLHTDASGTGLGAVLAQRDDDKKEYAVAYASRSLTKPERNYSVTEQECLAVIWAVEHFHQYLGTTQFYLITDHSALQWLRTSELKGRRARWILRLEPYNYTIIHRPGRKHNNADAMSRMYETEEQIYMLQEDNNSEYSFATANSVASWDPNHEDLQYNSEWYIAGRYCEVCRERAEDHHTHTFCNRCKKLSDKNRYPFRNECICKGKQRAYDTQSETTQLILDEIQPQPLVNRRFRHQLHHYNFDFIPRRMLSHEEFEEPVYLSTDYWWLPTLQQPSGQHRNEFSNYSNSYLCNSTWWMDTNQARFY
jgi:hypothetical protein